MNELEQSENKTATAREVVTVSIWEETHLVDATSDMEAIAKALTGEHIAHGVCKFALPIQCREVK
ncbi:hypothetical protein [Azonexus sp. IMCC34839]|uniref:hypothetical protein n=1 Tax=Azonexus sp. IMCC34839 TaxID=3133695 RepID=UPI003999B80A